MQIELVKQYESLWENDAHLEQIVDFCRQHLQKVKINPQGNETVELVCILQQSCKWGPMTCIPMFLKHLQDDDDELLMQLGKFYKIYSGQNNYCWRSMTAARILAMKTLLPEKVRAFFWCLMKREIDWPYSGLIYDSCVDITIVDNYFIRRALVCRHKTGYELIPPGLYFIDGKRGRFSAKITEAIRFDSVSSFEMELTLSGKKISVLLLRALLDTGAFNILDHLLRKRKKSILGILSPQDILICLCTLPRRSLEGKLKLIDTLEELHPGICKSVDKLGNTPLWYHGGFFDFKEEEIAQVLIRYGCNPAQKNHLGLSYSICKEMWEKCK